MRQALSDYLLTCLESVISNSSVISHSLGVACEADALSLLLPDGLVWKPRLNPLI